ncbi:winged helix-turn-helix transcriptional regulator [Halapricum desulfuricans]|uniref:winged helix-turn-helix transcriptional regulator n=1 Tax=Halapricum desulfuricans TaxID=2841257 RepID=UPI00374285CB
MAPATTRTAAHRIGVGNSGTRTDMSVRGRPDDKCRPVSGGEVGPVPGSNLDKPVATGTLLAEMLDVSKQSVLRRLQELEREGRVERWKVGSRAVVWWPTEES